MILAAGLSSRMGNPKLILPFKGKPVIRHVIDQALLSGLDGVVVVANPNVPELIKEIFTSGVNKMVINDQPQLGMSSSIKKGLAALPENADAVMILLGDQPLMTADEMNRMIDYYQSNAFPSIVQASYLGEKGHPVLFSRSLFKSLFTINGDQGGKSLIQHFFDQLHFVEMGKNITADIDTYSDYMKLSGQEPYPKDLHKNDK
jgi:molybdenum cofactor cytidylyltransferase